MPANDSLSCEAAIPADLPLHEDECGQSMLDVSMTTLPGTCPENYTLIRTFTAEDECGNASSAIQEVVFTDTVAPTILTTPADLVLACEDMVADSAITAEDNCSELTLAWLDSTVMGDCPRSTPYSGPTRPRMLAETAAAMSRPSMWWMRWPRHLPSLRRS